MSNYSKEFLEKTIAVWQPYSSNNSPDENNVRGLASYCQFCTLRESIDERGKREKKRYGAG